MPPTTSVTRENARAESPKSMNRRRLSTICLTLLCVCTAGFRSTTQLFAQDETVERSELTPENVVWPDAQELMTADPFDWVYTKNGQVLVVEPVYPRPDTLQKIATEKAELDSARGGTSDERAARNKRKTELREISIVLLDDESEDYSAPISQIEKIICFEDMMLYRANLLMQEGEIATAYDLLLEVEGMVPGWKKTVPLLDQLLISEATLNANRNNQYAALALLDELAVRNIEHPDLPGKFAEIIDPMISAAADAGKHREADYYLNRLRKNFPKHRVAKKWEDQFQSQMESLLKKAGELSAAGKSKEAAATAVAANNVRTISGTQREYYREYFSRHQTLHVPVRGFAEAKVVSPIELEADRRHRQLTTVNLFEPYAADELTYFQSTFFDLWDPTDLGREVVFSIKQSRPYWQTQPILTANQIADTLSDQLNPDLPSFNPRLASFVKEFSVRSPTELQVSFNRVPLNLEALFQFPVMAIPNDADASLHDAPRELLTSRFKLAEKTETTRTYRRTIPEPTDLLRTQYHIAEVVERIFPDRHSEIQAFVRGEVDVLPHLRPWEVDLFKANGNSFVQEYVLPQTHVLVFNPLSEATENPQIRRALSFGVDREKLLERVILRDAEMKYGKPAEAPWHSESYANSPLVDAPKYDMYLSFLLRMAALQKLRIPAKQKFVADAKAATLKAKGDWDESIFRRDNAAEINAAGGDIELPTLRFVVEADEVAMLAAEQMVIRWRALGFEIEMIPADTPGEKLGDKDWDFMYRSARLHEPLLDLWSLMLTDENFDVKRLASYPDWMRQELINLDYATSFIDAQKRLFIIHRHMAAQAFIVPLWELRDFIAFQRNMSGFERFPLSEYQNVERWQVQP